MSQKATPIFDYGRPKNIKVTFMFPNFYQRTKNQFIPSFSS